MRLRRVIGDERESQGRAVDRKGCYRYDKEQQDTGTQGNTADPAGFKHQSGCDLEAPGGEPLLVSAAESWD